MQIANHEVTPVQNKQLPSNFKKAVAMLKRPYLPITKQQYESIADIAENANTDIVMFKGQQMTFGNADDGYALMPLVSPI